VAFAELPRHYREYYLPDLALAFMYLVMLLVLVVRPGGLLGKEA
jgi:branched-subunit amino acid ABC-type transport system permease component